MTDAEAKPPRVVVAMDFTDDLMDRLRLAAPHYRIERHFPEVPAHVWADTEILYTLRTYPDPAHAPLLRWIQLHFAGVDAFINNPLLQVADIEVTTASGIHATQIAEYCLGMMLAFNLQIPRMLRLQAKPEWPREPHKIFAPKPLRGQTVGIVGYGSIGRELARITSAMGMRVLASKRNVKHTEEVNAYTEPGTGDAKGEIPDRIYPAEALASMARECDYLVLAAPLTTASRHAVDAEVLAAMKPNSVIVNIARGAVIDEKALVDALQSGKIRGAALDVFEEEPLPLTSPLWKLENVIISPHISGNTTLYHEKAAALFAENLKRYSEKRPLLNALDRKHGY